MSEVDDQSYEMLYDNLMIYYVNDVMDEDENNELAIATLELSKKYNDKKFNPEQYNNGKGSENRWLSGASSPQNSWNFTDIEYPDIVKTLSDRMSDAVAEISKGLNIWKIRSGMKQMIKPIEIWYNVYDDTQYQELHTHSPSIFSSVYFSKLPEGSSKLRFQYSEVEQKECCAVVFLSHMMHGVDVGSNIEPRITWSMNFE